MDGSNAIDEDDDDDDDDDEGGGMTSELWYELDG